MKDGVFGVLNNIICLYADVKISELFDLLTRRLYDEVKKKHTQVKISNPTQQLRAEYKISEMKIKFDRILTNQEWTWDKILADAKKTCGSSEKEGFSANNLQPKKVAQHFQVGFHWVLIYRKILKNLNFTGQD